MSYQLLIVRGVGLTKIDATIFSQLTSTKYIVRDVLKRIYAITPKARFILLTPSVSDKYCRRCLPPAAVAAVAESR